MKLGRTFEIMEL